MKRIKHRSGIVAGVNKDIKQMLEQYLRDRGWAYRCQQKADHKLPEWAILLDDEPAAVIQANPLAAEELLHLLRERPQQKQKQAKVTVQQHLPFLLAIEDSVFKGIPPDALDILKDNPQVSALGLLHCSSALGLARRVQNEPILTPEARCLLGVIDELLQKRWGIELSAREQSHIPDVEILWMEILLNPYANYPWLDELTGVYDKVYVWDESQQQWGLQYDGTPAVLRTLATRLLAGIVNAPFTDDVDASRSENFYEEREPTLHTA
jgi:hypothetical protein